MGTLAPPLLVQPSWMAASRSETSGKTDRGRSTRRRRGTRASEEEFRLATGVIYAMIPAALLWLLRVVLLHKLLP
jgi:hypothetical protein